MTETSNGANNTNVGINVLLNRTAGIAELALNVAHLAEKHVEYLPYPDKEFDDPNVDHSYQIDNKFSIAHAYDRDVRSFMPNVRVYVKSIDAERLYSHVTQFLNPWLYTIVVAHGPFEWTIKKRYKHFSELHKILVKFVEDETKRSTASLNKTQDQDTDRPCFPTRNDRFALINDHLIKSRCALLLEYLNKILKHNKFRNHPAVREFFEVSSISFVYGLSPSFKESFMKKRPHDDYRGRSLFQRIPFCFDTCKFYHGKSWFIMKDTYLTYINPSTYEIRFPMLVDRAFEFETGLKHTGTQHGIKVTNLQRSLVVKCKKKHEKEAWHQQLEILRERCTINGFCGDKANQFNSFVPMRENQLGYWFVNAKGYMESIAKAISNAKEEIFITDWWLSPELMLVRPSNDPLHRLDNLLGKKADEGIRIYIMIYREMSFAMGLNSAHTERVLKSKNKTNIKIIRHPRHHVTSGMQLLWSHHEKCVIIDQKIAFIGGIDLCYGRWDDDLMRLVDLGEENVRTLKSPAEIAAENLGSKKEPVEASKKIITEMAEDAGVTQSLGSEEMGANTGPRNKFEYEHPVDRKYAEANIRESIKDNIRQVENNKIDEKSSLLRIINNDKYDTISSTSHTSQSQPENKRLMSEKLLKFYRQQIHCACTLATVEIV